MLPRSIAQLFSRQTLTALAVIGTIAICLSLILSFAGPATAQPAPDQPAAGVASWGAGESRPVLADTAETAAPPPVDMSKLYTADPEARGKLFPNWKQRREWRRAGVTLPRMIAAYKRAKAAGVDPADRGAMALAMTEDLLPQMNPQALADPQFDMLALIEFIERLMPLIMKLIALFSI